MKVRLLLTLAGVAISFAVPGLMAQDAMKTVTADEVVWKPDPVLPKGAQTAVLIGDPSKAETIVLRAKFPPHFKIPPHNHTWSEVVTVLSGTCWNGMGDDMEKGVMLKPGSVFVLPANHAHQIWNAECPDKDREYRRAVTIAFRIWSNWRRDERQCHSPAGIQIARLLA
jgi:quercetin dioxygenase-like cupin family protein